MIWNENEMNRFQRLILASGDFDCFEGCSWNFRGNFGQEQFVQSLIRDLESESVHTIPSRKFRFEWWNLLNGLIFDFTRIQNDEEENIVLN